MPAIPYRHGVGMEGLDPVAQLRLRIQSQDRMARDASDMATGARHAELALTLREQLRALLGLRRERA